jgi:hypothetical protein
LIEAPLALIASVGAISPFAWPIGGFTYLA